MTRKKPMLIGIAVAVILVAVLIAGISIYNFHNTYVVISGTEYRRDAVELDLSGQQIDKLDKLKKLTGLQRLDLRDTGLTPQQYQQLQAELPDCEIIWSVPFQGGHCSSDLVSLKVDTISEADFEVFQYLPDLEYVKADDCTDYDVLLKLMEQHPQLKVTYTVTLSGERFYNSDRSLYIPDPDLDEIRQGLKYLPDVAEISFEGTLPEIKALIKMQQDYPDILFYWEFQLFGVDANTTMEFLDLSNIKLESTGELARYIPCFYNLTQVDMVGCGIANEEMVALNEKFPEVKFVWGVNIWGTTVRTDAKYFMPAKLHLAKTGNLKDLKYCTEMVVLDFGHYNLTDVSFIEYMPDLEYLLLCEAKIRDLSVIGNCTSLVTLELFKSPVTDFWPLTNLTNLRNLNLCKTPFYGVDERKEDIIGAFGDFTPLLQMTWLDRLWLTFTRFTGTQKVELRETLSHTEIIYYHWNSSIGNGWRHSYDYYYHRDVMGMYYMT